MPDPTLHASPGDRLVLFDTSGHLVGVYVVVGIVLTHDGTRPQTVRPYGGKRVYPFEEFRGTWRAPNFRRG